MKNRKPIISCTKMVVCDDVIRDQSGRITNVVRTDTLSVKRVPGILAKANVYARLKGAPFAEAGVRVEVLTPNTDILFFVEGRAGVDATGMADVLIDMAPLVIESSGTYRFRLFVDAKLVASRSLTIQRRS